ncbi:MAG TPA: hypothetical protein VMY99_02750 [Nevskiaceae bacterium]|nr:hypothetical protein [Nevskiaceae bacterium]
MSLTKQDLTDITGIVVDALEQVVNPRFDRLEAQMDRFEKTQQDHSRILGEHSRILSEHSQQLTKINQKVDTINGRIKVLEADVKKLYGMVAELQHGSITDKKFAKRTIEQKLLTVQAEVIAIAREAHIRLPAQPHNK